jgi:hypothetical protein
MWTQMDVLLTHPVNVNHVDSYSRSALSLAAEGGYVGPIMLFLRQPGISPDFPGRMGRTPFSGAVQPGNMWAVETLVKVG